VASRLSSHDELLASGLVEAELKAALVREGQLGAAAEFLPRLVWVSPGRPLGPEIDRVLATGHLKGADAWHLACALFLAPDGADLHFETLDTRQRAVATKLGFL
jgi:hypothetical protein